VVFDRIMETCNNAEIERLRFTAYVQGQIDQLNDKQDTVEIKIENHKLQLDTNKQQMDIVMR
jgi:hypothetical protein